MYVKQTTVRQAKQIIQRGGSLTDAFNHLRLNQFGGAGPFLDYYLRHIYTSHVGRSGSSWQPSELGSDSPLFRVYHDASEKEFTPSQLSSLRDAYNRDLENGRFPGPLFKTEVHRYFSHYPRFSNEHLIAVAAIYDKLGINPPRLEDITEAASVLDLLDMIEE